MSEEARQKLEQVGVTKLQVVRGKLSICIHMMVSGNLSIRIFTVPISIIMRVSLEIAGLVSEKAQQKCRW